MEDGWVKTISVCHRPYFVDEEIKAPRSSVIYPETHRSEARAVIQAISLKCKELPTTPTLTSLLILLWKKCEHSKDHFENNHLSFRQDNRCPFPFPFVPCTFSLPLRFHPVSLHPSHSFVRLLGLVTSADFGFHGTIGKPLTREGSFVWGQWVP